MPDPPSWVSATDLAEHAYCPRALAYRRAAPDLRPTPEERRGAAYHRRTLGRERWRADHALALWAALALGAGLAFVGVVAAVRP